MSFAKWAMEQQKKKGDAQTKPSSLVSTPSVNVGSFHDWAMEQHGISAPKTEVPKVEVPSASNKYTALKNNTDFGKYSSQGAAKQNLSFSDVERTWEIFGTDKRESKIENIVTYSRDNAAKLLEAEADRRVVAGSYLYKYMTDDEVDIYNYLLAKNGKDEAKEYLDTLKEELNKRYGTELGGKVSGTKGVGGAVAKGLFGLGAGTDQWVSGVKQLASDDPLPVSPTQVASKVVQDDLGDTGRLLYGVSTTVGNQLPSIALTYLGSGIVGGIASAAGATAAGAGKAASIAGKAMSALSMGGASAGNTYNEAMRAAEVEGYTKEQAKTYAALVGASEAGLGALLGGVGNITGLTDDLLLAKVAGIDKAFARLALSGAVRIGTEEVEEMVQLWVEPALKTLILKTEFEAPTWQEHVETAIITALSTGLMEGGSVVGTEINYERYGEMVLETHSENAVIGEVLANTKKGSTAYALATRLERQVEKGQKPTASDIGRLYTIYQSEVNPVAKAASDEAETPKTQTTEDKTEAPKTQKPDAKTETLAEMAKSEDTATATYATAQMAHTEETVVSPIAQTLMDSGMSAADAVVQADLIMKVQSGQMLSNTETKKLKLTNEAVRAAFTQATGQEVTDSQAQDGQPKRTVIRSAAEVAKAKADTASAEKAREAAVATERAKAEAVQNAEQQKAQADLQNAATAYAADMMAKAVEQAETKAAEPTIEFADGTTQTQSEFVEGYRSQFPSVSVEEAIDTFRQYENYNAMGQKVPGTAPTVAKDTNAPAKTEKKVPSKGKRNSIGDKPNVEVDQSGRTEAGRAKEREMTLKALNQLAGKSGVKVEVRDPDGVDLKDGDNGFYDASTKTIVLNSKKATNQFTMTYYFVHELTHHGQAKDGDVEKGLTHDIIEAMKSDTLLGKDAVEKLIAETRTLYENNYRKNNRDLSVLDKPNFIEDEVACNFMMDAIRDRDLLDKLAGVTPNPHRSLISRIRNFLKGKQKTDPGVAEARRLVERLQESLARKTEAQTGAAKGTSGETKRHSIDTLVEAVGLSYEKGEGGTTILRNAQGSAVDNVPVSQVKNSPLGAVIQSAVNGNIISQSDADKQVEFFSGLFNLMLETNDIDLVWAVSSAIGFNPVEVGARDMSKADTPKSESRFTAYTSNSDPQYSTTVDFTTICLKTKAIIDVMSDTMVRLKRGLSESEIVDIVYKEVYEAGEPVPCPVCYVFSRWVGLGGLFDKMWNNQKKYEKYSTDRLWDAVTRLEKDIAEIQSRNDVKRTKAISTLYKDMSNRQNALRDKDTRHRTAGGEPLTDAERAELDSLNADMEILDDWAWLTKVRLDPDYKPVPADILFDINKGKEFAEQYPKSWSYRTTRGPAMGKAATPYEAEHLGQILRGAGMNKSSIKENLGDQTKNPFLKAKTGKLSKAANTALGKSRNKVKAQNLLNGQRFQSTSDFRFEYALDYLLALTEMQALGSKIQMYTKVPESVRMMASCGAEVNCSLMPLGVGYDENGNLTFSSVTGMNPEDAFNLSAEFDNVQPIMVGTSDKHILLCMADDRITFIIPYHASGAGEARYAALMDIVGERVESRDDYSNYQTDHEKADATPEQKAARDLRKRILTGKAGTLTAEDAAILKGNTVLHELYKRFYGKNADGVAEAIDPKYLAPAQRESATSQDNECFGVTLTSDQASTIMPFEYWDRTLTRDQADENGRAFAEYCESLGMYPRFSGYDSKGFYRPEKDFSKVPGYWKMLGDRKLYNNDGTYHEQQTINITNFDASYLTREESVKGIVRPSQMNDPNAVSRITDKVVEQLRYSITPEQDAEYMTAVKNGDMETAQRMVDEAAKAAGYDTGYLVFRRDASAYNTLLKGSEIDERLFGASMSDDHGNLGDGLYFTPDRAYAERLRTGRRDVIRKFYLKTDAANLRDPEVKALRRAILDELRAENGSLEFSRDKLYQELMARLGKDGVMARGMSGLSEGAEEIAVRESWQAKLADPVTYDDSGNVIPLSERFNDQSADIRYSIDSIDSDGRQLSEQQVEFFKDSKVRDAQGKLMSMYHGTNNPNFTVFDPSYSDDNISLFFTDDPNVANTYTYLQDKGRNVDAYNLITEDSSAEDLNKAHAKIGSNLRVERVSQEWLNGMRQKAEEKVFAAQEAVEAYAAELGKNPKGAVFADHVRSEMLRLLQTDAGAMSSALFHIDQKSFSAHTKKIRNLYREASNAVNLLDGYQKAAKLTENDIGKFVVTETPDNGKLRIHTGQSGFSGKAWVGEERDAVKMALDRGKWALDYNLGNRYEVYLNITNPLVIDGGINYSGVKDNVRLRYNWEYGAWTVYFEDFEDGINVPRREAKDFFKSLLGDAYPQVQAQIDADNAAYQAEWGDLDEDYVDHDIELSDVYINYVRPSNWNALELNGAPAKTRDVAKYAKDNGYDGVIFKNIKDAGGYAASAGRNGSTVVVAFSPEQVKSTDNTEPTTDPDIRYSIDPTTGYEEGSTEDNVMKLLKAGSVDEAITHLKQWAQDYQSGKLTLSMDDEALAHKLLSYEFVSDEEAAENRAKLDKLIKKFGAIEAGERPARPVQVPKKVSYLEGVSRTARTVAEASTTPDWLKEEIEKAIVDKKAGFTYQIATDAAAMAYVDDLVREHGDNISTLQGKWDAVVQADKAFVSKKDIALGEFLYTQAIRRGDVPTAMRMVAELSAVGTQAGQTVQAMSLLKKMTPAGQLYYLQKAVDRMNSKNDKKAVKKTKSETKHLEDLKKQQEAAERELQEAEAEYDEAIEILHETQKLLESAKDTKSDVKQAEADTRRAEAQVKKILAELDKVDPEVMMSEFEDVQGQLEEVKALEREVRKAEKQAEAAKKRLSEKDIEAIKKKSFATKAELEKVKALEAEAKKAEADLRKAERQLEAAKERLSKHDIDGTKAKLADTQEQIEHFKSLMSEAKKVEAMLGRAEAKLDKLSSEWESSAEERAKVAADLAATRDAINDAYQQRADFRKLKAALKRAEATLERLNTEWVKMKPARTATEAQLEAIRKRVEEAKAYKASKQGKLKEIQNAVKKFNEDIEERNANRRFGRKNATITIRPDLAEALLNAKTEEEMMEARDVLLQDIADQVPVTLMEKWNTWRYLSMLGNPRTHIRNVLSNAVFGPVTWLKDIVDATLFQPFVKRENRTKHLGEALLNASYGLTGGLVKADKYIRFADADYAAMEDVLRGGGKYNAADLILDKRKIFRSKPGAAVNWAAETNSNLLEAEDAVFLKIHYVRALSQYLAAQKMDVATLRSTPEGLDRLSKARAWAVQEAQKATFRDASALATALGRLERSGVAGQLIVGGVMPFKKTPINILKRGTEYSPLGIVNTVKQLTKGGENTARTLDALASTVTGTGLIALGVYLAKEGLLRAGGSDDEKEREFEELQGAQAYSITLDDGTNYTIDWMAPAALPLFVGAKAHEVFSQDGELSASDFADVLMLIAEPMFQLSMLDGLNQTLTSAGYSDNPLSAVAASTLTSYIGQAVPTLLGQIARTVDDTRRQTYVDKNEDNIDTLERFKQYTQTKIPGKSEELAPRLDAWGRSDTESNVWLRAFENFISPGYVSNMKTSAMEEELQRLYETKGGNVLPRAMSKYFNVDKVRRDLTADEWVTYQTVAGQGAYEMLTRLVNSSAYRNLTDAQRVKAIEDVYTYANEKGKEAAVSDYSTDKSWIAKADKLADKGLSVEEYIVQSVLGDETSGQNTKDVMGMDWLGEEDKALLISSAYAKSLTNGNTFTDPNRSGYEYVMSDTQTSQYLAYYDELWTKEYNDLISGNRFKRATLDAQAEMVDDLKSEVAARTKQWMSRQLRQAGIRSTKKD